MFLAKALTLCLFFTSCGEPPIADKNLNPAQKTDKLLILNNIGENFTLVDNVHSERNVTPNFAMSLDGSSDARRCGAPSHIARNGDYFYVTCSLTHDIHMINASTLKTSRIISLLDSHNPMSTLIVSNDLAFTSGYSSNKVIAFSPHLDITIGETRIKGTLDLNTLNLEHDDSVQTLARPGGLALIGDTGFVALSNLDKNGVAGGPGYVLAFDLQTQSMKQLIKTRGRNTTGVYAGVSSATKNWLYIVNTGNYKIGKGYVGDGSIDVYDLEKTSIIQTIRIPNIAPGSLQFSNDGKVYMTNGMDNTIHSFNAISFETYAPIDLKNKKCGVSSPDNSGYISSIYVESDFLYATEFNSNCLLIVDRTTDKLMHEIRTGAGPFAMIGF